MFRFIGAAAVNASLFGYAHHWRKKNVEDVYKNMDKVKQEEIYNNCPVQKYPRGNDVFAAIEERTLTNYHSLQKEDKPKIPFKP